MKTLTVNIPRHRGRRAALYIGITIIVVVVVAISIALATQSSTHPYTNYPPTNVTASPTSTFAEEQPYIMAVNDLGINPDSLEIEA